MKVTGRLALFAIASILVGCSGMEIAAGERAAAAPRVELRDAMGKLVARARSTRGANGLRWRIEAAGLRPGTYALHIHQIGRCDFPDFASAGPHWNPVGRQHGSLNPHGPHSGDLPNLTVDAQGRGVIEAAIGGRPHEDADGAAMVIHANPDDYRTDPSGNSGARIACGVLTR